MVKTRAEMEKENGKQPEMIPEDLEMEPPAQDQQAVQCGDRVTLVNNRTGVVRYVGSTDFAVGEMYGIELDAKLPTGNDGSFGNVRYFSTDHGRGIFVRRSAIIAVDSLPITEQIFENKNDIREDADLYRQKTVIEIDKLIEEDIYNDNGNDGQMETIEEEEEEDIKIDVDSYVTLTSGQTGFVRYIGVTDFSKGEEVLGVELDQWDVNGNDGSRNGKKYFTCKNGRGIFVKQDSVIRVLKIPDTLKHLELKDLMSSDERDVRTGKKLGLEERIKMLEEKEKETQREQELQKMIEKLQVGDRVELDRSRTEIIHLINNNNNNKGTVRYIAPVEAASGGEAIGIELDKISSQGHDGKGKFATKDGFGIFVRAKEIKKVFVRQLMEYGTNAGNATDFLVNGENIVVHVDDRVRIQGGRTGMVRYVGPLAGMEDAKKQYIGLELDEWDPKATSGTFKGKEYFRVNANKGAFIDVSQVVENLGSTNVIEKNQTPPKPYDGDLGRGQVVKTKYYGIGTIMFMGFEHFSDGEVIGLELKQWWPNGSDGTVSNKEYFKCPQGRSYFCSRKDIEKVLTEAEIKALKESETTKNNDINKLVEDWTEPKTNLKQMPVIKDRVRVFDGQTGVIQFIGSVDFAEGTWIGLVLDDFSPNATDGTVKNKQYFRTKPQRGFFTKQKYLTENLGSIVNTPLDRVVLMDTTRNEGVKFKVGDRIQMAEGGTGVVKYVGSDAGEEETEPVIGVELDTWDPNANDGKFKGKSLFKTKMGRGLFTRRQSIMQVLPPKLEYLSNLKVLPDKGDRVRLRSGEEGIVQRIEKPLTATTPISQQEIQIVLLDSSIGVDGSKRIVRLSDLSENLGKYYDERYSSLQNEPLELKVGDHVRLLRGKTGKIKYVGPVGGEVEMIGVELDSSNPSGHNGKGYFVTTNGRGYFAKRSDVIELIERPNDTEQAKIQTQRYRQMRGLQKRLYKIEQLEKNNHLGTELNRNQGHFMQRKMSIQRQLKELTEAFNASYPLIEIDDVVKRESAIGLNGPNLPVNHGAPQVKTGDKVILDSGEVGKIMFIGSVSFDDREMLGILLDNWSPNGIGTVDGTQYFVAPEGRGLLVPFDSIVGLFDEEKEDSNKTPVKNDQRRRSMELEPVREENDDDLNKDDADDFKELPELIELQEEEKPTFPDLPKVGETINVGGIHIYMYICKSGVVKYVGKTDFSKDEPMIGIQLNSWSANATDGTLFGKKYFEAEPGTGYFVRRQSFATLKDMIKDDDAQKILRQDSLALENFDPQSLGVFYEKDDHVITNDGYSGKVAFIGKVKFAPHEMVGLNLDEWDPNGHNGTVRDDSYFEASAGMGWFARADCITQKSGSRKKKKKQKYYMKVDIGQRVQLRNGMRGLIRFYDRTDFPGSEKWVGLELDDWYYNAHDGTVNGKTYFATSKGRGFFVKPEEISIVLRKEEEKRAQSLRVMPELGDRVRSIRGKTGVVKFIGEVDFNRGTLIGVELDRWNPNAGDGTVNGVQYFTCSHGRGYFTTLSHLVENLGSTLPASLQSNSDSNAQDEQKNPPPNIKPGDKVKLAQGKVGVVRYIGTTEETGNEEIVGIELESWDANARDGTLGLKKLFDANKGRGYFTRRKSIANVVRTHIKDGAYAKLKNLVATPQYNGQIVKILGYAPEKQRWKVRLHEEKKDNKLLGVKEENLAPIFDWEVPPEMDSKTGHLTRAPLIGDRVRTKTGKTGIVRFVGETDFARDQLSIGLELDQWHPSAYSGTVDGKEYFKCKEGHGYFTTLERLVANLGQFDESEQVAPLPPKPKFAVGDKVKLARGKTGVVKFIGVTEFSKGEEIVGLELSQWTEGAHDGKIRGKRYSRQSLVADETSNSQSSRLRARREIKKTKRKLHQIAVLETRREKGETLTPKQLQRIVSKEVLLKKLNELENGNFDFEAQDRERKEMNLKKRNQLLERKATMDLGTKKWTVPVSIGDAVQLESGATGVVKWIGKVPFLTDDVLGLLMDESNPNYHNGELDGKEYFKTPNGRGYFALQEEVQKNMGTTKRTRPTRNDTSKGTSQSNVNVGDNVKTMQGLGKVVWKGEVVGEDGKNVEEMLGVELEAFDPNANDGSIQGTKYFESRPGHAIFTRRESLQLPLSNDFDQDQPNGVEFALGDRVKIDNGCTGVVRFVGLVAFDKKEEMVGIELDQWSPNGNNGSVNGTKYFDCPSMRGFFCYKYQIVENMGSTIRSSREEENKANESGDKDWTNEKGKAVKVGDHVELDRGRTGVVKWVGKTDFSKEEMLGIELDEWWINGHDGSKDGKKYFQCAEGHGYFAHRRSIAEIKTDELSKVDPVIQETNRRANRIERLRKHLRDIQRYEQRLAGGDRLHKGQIEKIQRKDKYKEELEQLQKAPPPNLQEIMLERQYEDDTQTQLTKDEVSIQDLKETQARESEEDEDVDDENDENDDENDENDEEQGGDVENNNEQIQGTSHRKSIVENLIQVNVGDRVRILGNKTGVVRYFGNVDFSNEKLVGIELDSWHPNATNGTVRGKTYFKCDRGRGFFAKESLILENLGHAGMQKETTNDEEEGTPPPQAPLPKIQFKIGDYVKLARGKTGVVKYIGETAFTQGEIIGLELDTWDSYGHNGTIRDRKYFEANEGRGYFTKRELISQVVIPLVKPIDLKTVNATFQLRPFKSGDRVQIKENGRTGIVKYVGFPAFTGGEVIGIELDEWSMDAHDGIVNNEVIFETFPGRGVFTRRDDIEKYDPEQKKLEEAKVQLKLGDKIKLTNNRTGVVKYIGADHLSDQEIIGVELGLLLYYCVYVNTISANDSTKHKQCPIGRGIFARRSSVVSVEPVPEVETKSEDSEDERDEIRYDIGDR
ncbi:hypothetical protein RFI_28196, partial [Reticulomyxa filosa]